MRDIGNRIRKYRLQRYAGPEVQRRRRLRWAGLAAAVWLLWAGVVSDHSFYRLWRLQIEKARTQQQLDRLQVELRESEAEITDPQALRDLGERRLREQSGMSRPGEIVYRVQPAEGDSLAR
jgi:cell division protein FtsB